MAENIELIAAKDLPTTEAEEVSVLCIDNGELKQKPGASFGGGGYVIVVEDPPDLDTGTGVVNESYDNFIDVLLSGGPVWVNFTSVGPEMVMRALVLSWLYADGSLTLEVRIMDMTFTLNCPNGTWTPEG